MAERETEETETEETKETEKKEEVEKLSPPQIKQLLEDAERTNLARKEVNLLRLCKADPRTFGYPRTPRRRAFQKKWGQIKRKSIQKYRDLLEDFGVKIGSGTQQELQGTKSSDYYNNKSEVLDSKAS